MLLGFLCVLGCTRTHSAGEDDSKFPHGGSSGGVPTASGGGGEGTPLGGASAGGTVGLGGEDSQGSGGKPDLSAPLIVSYTGGAARRGVNADKGDLCIGQQFSVTSDSFTLFDLGIWDYEADGLFDSHAVTLFSLDQLGADATATPVPGGSVVIPPGTEAELQNGYRFVALPEPLELPPGDYSVVTYGMDANDPYGDGGHLPVPASGVIHGDFTPYEFASLSSPNYPAGGGTPRILSTSFRFSTGESPPLYIMPMGDSITWGVGGTNAGYRAFLLDLLNEAGISFQFVGSLAENTGSLSYTQAHQEGHRGWVIESGGSGRDGLMNHIEEWLGPSGVHPDVILLMIGSNDVNLNYQMATAKERLDGLVSKIRSLLPDVHLVLAQVTGLTDPEKDQIAVTYNEGVAEVAAAHASLGEKISLVDMHTAVPLTDMDDWIHPNDDGYEKMADEWLSAIVP